MASTFAGLSLFDSGPHRFAVRTVGRYVGFPFEGGSAGTTIELFGQRELVITQTGRLVGPTDASVWQQFDDVRTRAESATTGDLVDHAGRVWRDMTLVERRAGDRVDRGREVSLGYRATYVRF